MSDFVGAYITGLFDDHQCNSGPTASGMAASVMTDYIFWSIHVDPSGNLHYNDEPLVTDGSIQPAASCLADVIDVAKQGQSSSLQRVWLSIGAGGTQDFTNIWAILQAGGSTLANMLANFQAIAQDLGIYGFDYDNEDQIGNVDVIVQLTTALYEQDDAYRFSFCPYGPSQFASAYWIECLTGIYTALSPAQPVEGFNLQCYSGGASSDPPGWVQQVENAGSDETGIQDANALVRPGMAVQGSGSAPAYTPSQMTSHLQAWGSVGGWIWNTEEVLSHDAGSPSIADYASAIAVV